MSNRIIYIDMDDVLCDFSSALSYVKSQFPEITYPQSLPDFFLNLIPLPGAISTFNSLLDSTAFDPYILTAPSIENPLCYTEKRLWVERHLGFKATHRLIICSNKGLLKGDILIDDWDHGRGQENFEGTLLKFGSPEFLNWQIINNYLHTLQVGS